MADPGLVVRPADPDAEQADRRGVEEREAGAPLRTPETLQSAPAAHQRAALRSVACVGSHSAPCRLFPRPLPCRQ